MENENELPALAKRQKQIALLLQKGNSYKMIAAELRISSKTVDSIISGLHKKYNVHSNAEMINLLQQNGLLLDEQIILIPVNKKHDLN